MNKIVDINRDEGMASILHSHLYSTTHGRPYSDHRHNIELYPIFEGPKTLLPFSTCLTVSAVSAEGGILISGPFPAI